MNIAVICGGLSSERDVSITSGTNAARALREQGHKVVLVDLFERETRVEGRLATIDLVGNTAIIVKD